MNTTVRLKASEIYKDWHVIDATGRPLGRVASEAAILLRGKHKPTFEPHLDDGDFVIVVNASKVKVTGRKVQQNAYYTHSGFPGGLRRRSMAETMERFPGRVIEAAVKGMLPGGPLGEAMAKHLKVYPGPNHPHQSQVTGSERARAIRETLATEQLLTTKKPPRLRPLSVPDAVAAPVAKLKPVTAPAPARRVRKPAKRTPEPVVAPVAEEAPVPAPPARRARKAAEPVAPVAVVEQPVEAAPEVPKKRAPRKKAEPATAAVEKPIESTAEEAPKKPVRRRAAPPEKE